MTRLSTVCALAVGLLFVGGCGTPEFKEFQSQDGRFKVQMPGKPKEEKQETEKANMTVYTVERADGAYIASFCDPPKTDVDSAEKIEAFLDVGRDNMVRNISGTLLKESKITLANKYPGREVQAELSGKKGMVRGRFYMVDGRLYQVLVAGTPAWIVSPDVDKFFDSFALTNN